VTDTKKMDALGEESRLRALRATGLLDTEPEAVFDRFTKLAAKLLKVPMAAISLVDDERQFFKSSVGLSEARALPLTDSVCKHVVARKKPLLVSDARTHYELRDNRAMEGLGVVAYAGVPLLDADRNALGAFCALDTQERHWSDDDLEILRELAEATMAEITLRRAARNDGDSFYKAVFDGIEVGLLTLGSSRRITWANAAAQTLFGYAPGELVGSRLFDLLGPGDRELERTLHSELCDGARSRVVDERRMKCKDGRWIWVRRTLSTLPSDAPQKRVVLAALEEIQGHKQLAERLQHSEERYRAVTRSLPGCALMRFDRELRHTMAEGDELLAAAGTRADQVAGKTIRDIASTTSNARKLEQAYRAALRGETSVVEILRGERYFTFNVAPMTDGGFALVYDSTGYRRTADALDLQVASLRLLRRIAEETMRPESGWSLLRACVTLLCVELRLPVGHAFLVEGERLIGTELWHIDDLLTRRPFVSATNRALLAAGLWLPCRALKEGRPVLCADFARDPDFQRAGPALSSGLHAGFALPVRGGGRMVAVIECYADRVSRITTDLLDVLAIAGAMLGRVVERGPLVPE
jgi:PAS domain S-box-containing protein